MLGIWRWLLFAAWVNLRLSSWFYFLLLTWSGAMTYNNIPLIIPILAAGYLIVVYVLLMLVERKRA